MPGKPTSSDSVPLDPKRRAILGVSVGINLLLLVVLAGAWIHRSGLGGFGDWKARGPKKEASLAAVVGGVPGAQAGRTRVPARETPWSRLQSEDPRIFAANLRNAGCPEQTVCDLVRPAVNRWFDRKRGEIGRQDPFWVTGRVRTVLREKNDEALRALAEEKVKMIRELSCALDFKESDRNLEVFTLVDFFSGFLGTAKQEALVQFALEQEIRRDLAGGSESSGVGLPEDLQAEKAASDSIRARLDQILTRNEKEELDLRLSLVPISLFRDDTEILEPLHLTLAEVREFVRIVGRIQGSLLEELYRLDHRLDPPRSDEDAVEPALKSLLGPERFALYQKKTDSVYQRVEAGAKNAKLPGELADQTYGMVAGFSSDLEPIRVAWEASPVEARPILMAWRAEQRSRLNSLLSALPEADRKAILQMAVDEAIQRAWRKR